MKIELLSLSGPMGFIKKGREYLHITLEGSGEIKYQESSKLEAGIGIAKQGFKIVGKRFDDESQLIDYITEQYIKDTKKIIEKVEAKE